MIKPAKNNKQAHPPEVNRLLDWKKASCVTLVFALVIGGTLFTRHIQANKSPAREQVELQRQEFVSEARTELQSSRTFSTQVSPTESKPAILEQQDFEPDAFAGMKARFAQVAAKFSEDIKYPSTSKPILDENELEKYLPNRSVESTTSMDTNDKNSVQVSIKSSKQQYFVGEDVIAQVGISNVDSLNELDVAGRIVAGGKTLVIADEELAKSQSIDANNGTINFTLKFEFNSSLTDIPENLQVVASAQTDAGLIEVGTPISYVSDIAKVTGIQNSEVREEYLHIPVDVQTNDPGFHQLSAVLYSVQSGKALVSLSAQKELLTEYDFIPLNAHIAALKAVGDEGPYLLKNISLTRMPSKPNYRTEYGSSIADSFDVDGHSFDAYEDIPFEDAEAQARLDFLNQLAKK